MKTFRLQGFYYYSGLEGRALAFGSGAEEAVEVEERIDRGEDEERTYGSVMKDGLVRVRFPRLD